MEIRVKNNTCPIRVEKFVAHSWQFVLKIIRVQFVLKKKEEKTAKTLIKRNKRNKKILQANSLKRDA